MKTPTEIHAEVGQPIVPHLIKHYQEWEYRAYKKDDIAKIISDAKAEEKGVCEWKEVERGHHDFVQRTSYKNVYFSNFKYDLVDHNFCPGCGKEIKVV